MERRAAKISFVMPAVAFLLVALQACAPAVNPKAQISFTMKGYASRNSGLAYDSTTLELSDDLCYAIHVTSSDNHPAIQRFAPSPEDLACENGPRGLGILTGTFAKGSVAEMDVPVGPKRRFDLVALPKSKIPGGQCVGGLRAEVTPRETGSTSDGPKVTLYLGTNALPDDDGMRLIARGEADINPGVIDVVLEGVAVDPQGVEYGCGHNSGGSEGTSTVVTSGPGSSSQPIPRPAPYLQIFLSNGGAPTGPSTPIYVNMYNEASFPVGGACSVIGEPVTVSIGGVTESFPCDVSSTPFLNNFDGKYYTEGRWSGVLDLDAVSENGDPLNVSVTQTLNGNTFSADDYVPLSNGHAFVPEVYKDTTAPVVYAYSPTFYSTPSPRKVFSGGCDAAYPVYIKTCAISGGTCPAPATGETMASIPCNSGSFELEIMGSTVSGNITFKQIDDAGNSTEYTSP